MVSQAEPYMKKLGIIFVLLIAFFFRVYRLGELPVAMFGDEVDASYQAWSLATTLKDYRGHFLPTYIQSLAEWRAPLEMYAIAPFVGLLGPTTFSARLPMALFGVLSIYLTYLIVNLLFTGSEPTAYRNKLPLGLIAALILALTPWHLHYSRNVTEQPPLFLLELLGVYFYLKAKEKPLFYPLSLFAFILTFYTYSIANLATPTLVLILLFCFPPRLPVIRQPKMIASLLICLLAILPIAYHILFGQAAGRFRLISIGNDQNAYDQILADRSRPWLPYASLERVFNNRPVTITREYLKNYITALSPQFMFISGDPIYRQSVDYFGVFLISLAPFFLCGLYCLAKEMKNRSHFFPLLWLFLIPLGSSLTQGGGNHASRLFLMNFPFAVIAAVGIVRVVSLVKEKTRPLVTVAILLMVGANFAAYWYRYTSHYAYESSHVWQYGYEPLFTKSRDLIKNANRVFINNTAEPALYRFAFYYPIHPADFQRLFTTDIPTDNLLPGFDGFRFGDKYYLGTARSLEGITNLLRPGDIYFASQAKEIPGDWDLEKSPPGDLKVLLTVRDFYSRPLFYVLGR